MKSLKNLAIGAALLASASVVSFAAMAKDLTVGVSWSNFQEERWKTDEAAIKKALAAHGAKYISADAQASPTKQLTDVEDLISKGANVLIILAMDSEAILPAVKKAADEGIPVIAYDRLIESPNVLYITFNNVERRTHDGEGDRGGEARRQLRLHQGRQGRPERGLPVLRHQGSARSPR